MRTLTALPLVLLVAACGAPEITPEQDSLEPGVVYETESAPGPQVVFINFNGPTIANCGNYCSDAPTNRSWIMGYFGHAKMDFAAFPHAERAAVVTDLKQLYAGYNVEFVTTRPTSGHYTMVVVTPTVLPHHGIAPLDCNNANKNDIAFVDNTGDKGFYPDAHKIAQAAAHELGHSFGLSHVTGTSQIMQWASSGSHFGASTYDSAHPSGKCFSGTTQHAAAMLAATLGTK